MSAARPPAGWYPDPLGSAPQRWWDGYAWTGFLHDPEFRPPAVDGDAEPDAAADVEPDAVQPAATSASQAAPTAPPVAAERKPVAPQRVLLGLGAALLIAAAAAFIAFAWTVVGPSGRAALITLVAAGFLIAAVRVRLTAIRETFAVVGMGTVAVEIGYGTSAGLIPEGAFDASQPWLAVTFALATVACWALGTWARLLSARIVAGGTYVIAVVAGIAYVQDKLPNANAPAVFVAALAVVVALTFAVPRLATWPSVRIVSAMVLAGLGWVIVCLALLILFAEDSLDVDWVLALAVIAAAAGGLRLRVPAGNGLAQALVLIAVAFAGSAAGLGLGLGLEPYPVASAVTSSALGCGVLLAGLQVGRPWVGVTAALPFWALWSMASGFSDQSVDQERWALAAFVTAAAVLSLGFAALGREPRVVWAAGPLGILAAWLVLDTARITTVEIHASAFAIGTAVMFTIAGARGVVRWPTAIDGMLLGALAATVPSAVIALTTGLDGHLDPDEWVNVVVAAAGIIGAYVVAILRRRLRWLAIVGSVVLLLELWMLVGDLLPGDPTVEYLAWTTFACFTLAVLIVVARERWPVLLGWGAIVAAAASTLPAALWAWDVDTSDLAVIPWLSVALAAVAVAALVMLGFREPNAWLFWIAAALAWTVLLGVFVVRVWPDDWRCAPAVTGVVLLVAGACTRRVLPSAHSMLWLGIPALFVVVPFALEPGCTPASNPVGFTVVLVATGALAVAGAWRRIAGLLVPGAVGLAIIVINVMWEAALAVPAWVPLGLAGALLLVIGVRLESTRAEIRKGTTWLKTLD